MGNEKNFCTACKSQVEQSLVVVVVCSIGSKHPFWHRLTDFQIKQIKIELMPFEWECVCTHNLKLPWANANKGKLTHSHIFKTNQIQERSENSCLDGD